MVSEYSACVSTYGVHYTYKHNTQLEFHSSSFAVSLLLPSVLPALPSGCAPCSFSAAVAFEVVFAGFVGGGFGFRFASKRANFLATIPTFS